MSKTKSIIGGMTVLGLSGMICKVVGVLYIIPLTWLIGTDGLGIYQTVFPTYNLLLTISSAGLPVAVSRMVAARLSKDDPRGAKNVFRVAALLLLILAFDRGDRGRRILLRIWCAIVAVSCTLLLALGMVSSGLEVFLVLSTVWLTRQLWLRRHRIVTEY